MSVLDFSNNENELSSSLQDGKHAYSSPFIRSNAEPSRLGAGRAGCRLGNSQGTGPKSQSGVRPHSETAFPVVHPWIVSSGTMMPHWAKEQFLWLLHRKERGALHTSPSFSAGVRELRVCVSFWI